MAMAVEWYLQDLRSQHGPLGIAELRKKLASYANIENVLVWREGFPDWKTVAEVFEFFDAPSALNQRKRVKGRWALCGLTFGILLSAADIIFGWRGEPYLPWNGHEFENIDRASASLVIPLLLFFLAGALKDALFSRWKIGGKLTAVAVETAQQIPPGTWTARRYNNFVAKNWRGEYPLFVSYWVFGVIGNLALPLITLGLAFVFESKTGFEPTYVFGFILSVWIVSIGISVWLWVGVWRSANRYIEGKSLKLERAPWAGVAKLMCVLAFIQLGASFLIYGIPQVTEASRVAFRNDPDIPEYFIRVMRGGTEAEITGGIKYGLADDFKKILRASRQIRVVHLNSTGGRLGEGEKLYNLIRDARLNTYVSAKCLSACTLAFSAGAERLLLHGAVLGFHRASFAGKDEKDSPELQGQRKIFTEAGYDGSFIARALATPSSGMWTPTEAELLNSGVVTKISSGSDCAISGLPADVSRDWFSKSLKENAGIYAAIAARFPKDYDDIVSAYYDAFAAGRTEAEAISLLRDKLENIISVNRYLADDDVLIDLGNLIADQLAALQKQSPAICYNFATTGVLDNDLLPQVLSKRELDIKERIVRTAAKRPDADARGEELRPKLLSKLAAKGITKSDLDLIQRSKVVESQQARFCSVMMALYREAAAMPQNEGAGILRTLVSTK
jgi:hypothetical protein